MLVCTQLASPITHCSCQLALPIRECVCQPAWMYFQQLTSVCCCQGTFLKEAIGRDLESMGSHEALNKASDKVNICGPLPGLSLQDTG